MDYHQRVLDFCLYFLGCHFLGGKCNFYLFKYVYLAPVVQHLIVGGLSRVAHSCMCPTRVRLHFSIIHEVEFEPIFHAIYIRES
jgi:hypothetical protein